MMSTIDRVLPLIYPIDLLLQLLPPIRNFYLYIVNILGDALNAKQVGGMSWARMLFLPSVVDDLLMVSQYLLYLGKSVWIRGGVLVRYRYSFFDLCREY